jgi:hypothetical protein
MRAWDSRRNQFWCSNPVQDLPQPLTIPLAMSRAAKFVVPEEPKWTDLFAAIQTAHRVLVNSESIIDTSILGNSG